MTKLMVARGLGWSWEGWGGHNYKGEYERDLCGDGIVLYLDCDG